MCRPHRSACDSQINLPIYTFKLFKTTRRRNETELNSLLARCRLLAHTRSAHKHRVFQTARHTDLIPLSCIPAFKIHMHGGLRLRRNTGNTSVLNHEGEPMDINLCATVHHAGECRKFCHTESESIHSAYSLRDDKRRIYFNMC